MKEKEQSCGTKKLMGLFLTGKRKNKLAGLFIDFKGAMCGPYTFRVKIQSG